MNWGNKLLLTFVVFASGMAYMVYRSTKVNFELVEKDYYKSELRYQEVIDGANRVSLLASDVSLEQTNKGVMIQLPDEMKNHSITGDVLFYCAYDEKNDRKFPLQLNSSAAQQLSADAVLPGVYSAKINWKSEGKNYFSEKKLTIH